MNSNNDEEHLSLGKLNNKYRKRFYYFVHTLFVSSHEKHIREKLHACFFMIINKTKYDGNVVIVS